MIVFAGESGQPGKSSCLQWWETSWSAYWKVPVSPQLGAIFQKALEKGNQVPKFSGLSSVKFLKWWSTHCSEPTASILLSTAQRAVLAFSALSIGTELIISRYFFWRGEEFNRPPIVHKWESRNIKKVRVCFSPLCSQYICYVVDWQAPVPWGEA